MEIIKYDKRWSEIKDEIELKEDINRVVLNLYQNRTDLDIIHSIFTSKWSKYIDLSYKKSSLLEFASYLAENDAIEQMRYLLDWAKKNNKENEINHTALHNIVITATQFDKIKTIKFIFEDQEICPIDFSYEDYAIITNCCNLKGNVKKESAFKYFVIEGGLKKTVEVENIIKKNNKEYFLKYFNSLELYKSISNKIAVNNIKDKKLKI